MSGKNAQRTKGNIQPSNSSRSAKFLQEGQTGGISFGFASQEKGDAIVLDGELRLLLRKMAKKDTVTKLKAVQEFTLLCKDKDGEMIKNIFNFWPRMYNKLAHDFDHRVREATQQAHYQLTTKAGRNIAPYLKAIIVNWLMCQYDTHAPAASTAKLSFDEVFQENKRKEVLSHCKNEILQTCEDNILHKTADMLSDPKHVPLEERVAKYNRFVSSSFHLLEYFLKNFSKDDDVVKETMKNLFADKKFWKFSKQNSPMIRSSFFTLLSTCCEELTTVITESLNHLGPTVLTNFDEQDPTVVKALWDALLCCLSTFENIWQFVNPRKAVWPKLWKLLQNCGYGNIDVVYPNILVLLSNIPSEVAGEGTGFYAAFFTNLMEGLENKQKVLSESDTKLVITTYMECLRYILVKSHDNQELRDYIINTLLADTLHKIFHSPDTSYGTFIKELHSLQMFIYEEMLNDTASRQYKQLHADLWNVISKVLFTESDNVIKFKQSHSSFFQSLMDFLSYCCENRFMTNLPYFKMDINTASNSEVNTDIGQCNDDHLRVFIQNVLKCYIIEIFSKKQFASGNQLIKLISSSLNVDLIKFVCMETLSLDPDSAILDEKPSTLDVCKCFVNSVMLPLLGADIHYQKEVIKILIALVDILSGTDKHEYLISIFEGELFSGGTLLALFAEVFTRYEEEYIGQWLKSDFVEQQIMHLCTIESENINEVDELNLLRMYMQIVEDNPEKLSVYHSKLLVLITYYIDRSDQTDENIDATVLSTFESLCKPGFNISDKFLETLFAVFRKNVSQAEKGVFTEAMNQGFVKIMIEDDAKHFKEIVAKLTAYVKKTCVEQVDYSRLCGVICSLVQLAEDHSKEISYGKILLEEILTMDEEFIINQGEEKLNIIKFYSEFLNILSTSNNLLLQICCEKKLNDIIFKCIVVGNEQKSEDILTGVKKCIKSCEFIHFILMDEAINRCLQGKAVTDLVKHLLQILFENEQLSESILDHCLMLSAPSKYEYMDSSCDTYCTIVSIVDDISFIRALVEMYVDELNNNADVKATASAFGSFIKVLSAVICRWYEILHNLDTSPPNLEDYKDIVLTVMDNILVWKEDHSEMILFSCLVTEFDSSILLLNIELIRLLCQLAQTSLEAFKPEHLDFLLCSMISWLQTCEESFNCLGVLSLFPQFMHVSFKIFNIIASSYDSSCFTTDPSTCNISPCIYLIDASPMSLSLSEDALTEWKEFFLPTASTSLLQIYMKMIKNGQLDVGFTELENMVCSCIRFAPPATLSEFIYNGCHKDEERENALEEFCAVAFRILNSGNWWNKIAAYQLLTRLGDQIETKLCVSEEEDEDHEGMRSFPSSLIKTMENSRDETLEILSAEEVSIKDPLKSFDDPKGKTALLTYLLSWQLILQLFKLASPSDRAMFANYFHNNSDVHDLITCLFCLMSQTFSLEYKEKVTLANFNFQEIRQVAFHLLTSAMECIPALTRNWFNNHVNRVDAGTVDRFVTKFISPVLLQNEFQKLNDSSKDFNNMMVKTRSVARQIAAIYTVDEVSMELVVELSADHPLSPVSVTCGKRIGVSNALWRQWMLQLNTFLSFQNGSILDGLALWKRNVDKRFEGVEECMICFSVLHGSNYSLPSIGCKTCHKKFHPACLYKWFNTSGKCTCPLCRHSF